MDTIVGVRFCGCIGKLACSFLMAERRRGGRFLCLLGLPHRTNTIATTTMTVLIISAPIPPPTRSNASTHSFSTKPKHRSTFSFTLACRLHLCLILARFAFAPPPPRPRTHPRAVEGGLRVAEPIAGQGRGIARLDVVHAHAAAKVSVLPQHPTA